MIANTKYDIGCYVHIILRLFLEHITYTYNIEHKSSISNIER